MKNYPINEKSIAKLHLSQSLKQKEFLVVEIQSQCPLLLSEYKKLIRLFESKYSANKAYILQLIKRTTDHLVSLTTNIENQHKYYQNQFQTNKIFHIKKLSKTLFKSSLTSPINILKQAKSNLLEINPNLIIKTLKENVLIKEKQNNDLSTHLFVIESKIKTIQKQLYQKNIQNQKHVQQNNKLEKNILQLQKQINVLTMQNKNNQNTNQLQMWKRLLKQRQKQIVRLWKTFEKKQK